MAASTIAPMAIAMPPRLMMFAFTPIQRITTNEMRMPSGRVTIATSAERTCTRKRTATPATISDSSSSLPSRLAMARWMRSERSYTGTSRTPCGRLRWISAMRALTASIVFSASLPNRMITMPATTSPRPFRSAAPRRGAGPTCTVATSATRIGVPSMVAPTATSPISCTPRR
jgi:hypothetical protein